LSCQIQGTNEVLLQGIVGVDGLYSFPNLKLQDHSVLLSSSAESTSASVACSSTSSSIFNSSFVSDVNKCLDVSLAPSSTTMWHARLAHPNSHVLGFVLNHCKIAPFNKNVPDFCSCCVGKSHRLPSSISESVYSKPLEHIFTDLWGLSHVTSHSGYVYCVSFIDAYSKFTWFYPLKSKSETFTVFQHFKAMVENQFNSKIKGIQSDWGGEYRSFTSFLATHCISHRLICPHTHHQNGVVERKQCHIVELDLTLLHYASLPLTFWDYAFTTSVYLINHIPTASLNFAVPYSVLFNKSPDYSFSKTFGCACFTFLRPYTTQT